MVNIYFKATRRASTSCEDYRQIAKRGDVEHDMLEGSDDGITFYPKPGTRVIIDCDKKTGEFRVAFEPK